LKNCEENDLLLDFLYVKDIDLSGRTIKSISAHHTFFDGKMYFRQAIITEAVKFVEASISGVFDFEGATFCDTTTFFNVIFIGKVNFKNTIFKNKVEFHGFTFCENVDFNGTVFDGEFAFMVGAVGERADFDNCKFNINASFEDIEFHKRVDFFKAEFFKNADFARVIFFDEACFQEVRYDGETKFAVVTFKSCALYSLIAFNGNVLFIKSNIYGYAYFHESGFNSKAEFKYTEFNMGLTFEKAKVNKLISFDDCKFNVELNFNNAIIDNILFNNITFTENTYLRFASCNQLETTNCINEKNIDLFGVRFSNLFFSNFINLGQLNIDWEKSNISKALYGYEYRNTVTKYSIAAAFNLLKLNFNAKGQYDDDKAYVEYRRCLRKSKKYGENHPAAKNQTPKIKRIWDLICTFFNWLIYVVNNTRISHNGSASIV